jgi:hypothetical protein
MGVADTDKIRRQLNELHALLRANAAPARGQPKPVETSPRSPMTW